MADAALDNAVAARDEMAAKIASAEDQIKEWRARMQRAERFISDWEEFSGKVAPKATFTQQDLKGEGASKDDVVQRRMSAKAKNPKKEEVALAAVNVIRSAGTPMNRTELKDALVEAGVVIHGTRPEVVLQTMLWRMSDVVAHIKGHGYWPADTAYPPGEYDPDAPDSIEASESEIGLDEDVKAPL